MVKSCNWDKIFHTVRALELDDDGIFVQHASCDNEDDCCFTAHEKIERLFSFKDPRNYLHLWRVLHIMRYINKHLKGNRDANIVDLGAGFCEAVTGLFNSRTYYNYYCMDFDYRRLKTVAKRTVGNFNRVLVRSDLMKAELPFPDESVDCIVCAEFAEHIPTKNFTLLMKEVQRIARPDAKCVFTTPNGTAGGVESIDHIYEYDQGEFHALLEACGFEVDKQFGFSPVKRVHRDNELARMMEDFVPTATVRGLMVDDKNFDAYREAVYNCTASGNFDIGRVAALQFPLSDEHNTKRGRNKATLPRIKA